MKSFRLGLPRITIFDEDKITDDLSSLTINNLIFEPLLKWIGGKPAPALISEWEYSEDAGTWRFKLRENTFFHDGKKCTTEDIFAVFEKMASGYIGHGMDSPYQNYLSGLHWEAESDSIFHITSKQPCGFLPELFCDIYIKRRGGDGKWLGTGPYRIEECEEDRIMVNGVGPHRIHPSLELIRISSHDDRMSALRSGYLDAASELPLSIADKKNDSGEIFTVRSMQTLSITGFLNAGFGIFSKEEARIAVNYAIDRRRLINEVYHGCGVPAATVVSPAHIGFSSGEMPVYPYDPEKAKRLFELVSLDGDIQIHAPEVKPDAAPELAAFLKDELSEIGLSLEVMIEPDRTRYALNVSERRNRDISIFDSSPYSTYRVLYEKIDSSIRWNWWQGVIDAPLSAMIASAAEEGDTVRRADLYRNCLSHLNRHPQWLYLLHPVIITGFRSKPQGIRITPYGIMDFFQ